MIARELEKLLATLSGYQPGEIDQRVRPLREHDLIPHGPRGTNAPHIEPLHAALILLCLVARRAADAGPVAIRAMDLKAVPRAGQKTAIDDATLAVVIASAIQSGRPFVARVEIDSDGSAAWVDIVRGKRVTRLLFTDDAKVRSWVDENPDTYDAQGAHRCCHKLVLTGDLLATVGIEMSADKEREHA